MNASTNKRERGFTLLEVLIALAIVAMSVGALLGTVTSSASNVIYLKEKTLAEWVALNRLTEIRIAQQYPAKGRRTGNAEMGGQKWQWEEEVTELQIKGMFRVDIRARPTGETVDDRRSATTSSNQSGSNQTTSQKTDEGKSAGDELDKLNWTTSVAGVIGSSQSRLTTAVGAALSGNGPNQAGGPGGQPGGPGNPPANGAPGSPRCAGRARIARLSGQHPEADTDTGHGSMMRRASSTLGFTIIEVVIAIFISAIMFAIGYGAINQALADRDQLNVSQQRVNEIQRGMRIVAQDFGQIAMRAARDTQGTGQLMPAVLATGADNTLITFTRTGWSNPAGIQRPAEQRVRYRFVDGSLVRDHWLAVDPALNTEPRQRVLLTKVTSVEIRFLDPVSRSWRTDWPVVTTSGPVSSAMVSQVLLTRPLAIELTVVFEDWGRVQRIFEIPT